MDSNKRIRVENWLRQNKKFINVSLIDRELDLKGATKHFLYDDRKINSERINKLFSFIKKITIFSVSEKNSREAVENWLKRNEKYLSKTSIDKELFLNESVRRYLYNGQRIKNNNIRKIYLLIKKIIQF